MTKILVVDDSVVERHLVRGLLKTLGEVEVEFAENGVQAVERVEHAPPDLVLTDLMMPEMNGLELVNVIRERFCDVPIILLTAFGNETLAVTALEQGAACYVPKSQQTEILADTVQRVLARREADRRRERVVRCIGAMTCYFILENDPSLIRPLVDVVQQQLAEMGLFDPVERINVGLALEEAITNAMGHGNLELSQQEMAAEPLLSPEGDHPRIAARCSSPPYCNRKVTVTTHLSTFGARFDIGDEGHGFKPQEVLDREVTNSFDEGHGRGLLMMHKSMDEVSYNETGNHVTLIRRCHDAAKNTMSTHGA
ncbi:MAG: response regulator [Planctomycetes bacterium]|nr:response regulator [Planctomycetota bacterium]